MKSFIELRQNLKKDFSQLKKIKLAILGDTATQFLHQALRGAGFDYGCDLLIWEADFNQIERQVFDPDSDLFEYNPDIIIIFQSTHKLLSRYNKLKPYQQGNFAADQFSLAESLFTSIRSLSKARILFFNFPEIDDAVFGNYANKVETSFLFQLRKLNYELMHFSTGQPDLYLIDLSAIQNNIGKKSFFQASIYINTDMVLSLDVLPKIAFRTMDTIAALYGRIRKCLVLDLDNTLWGGVIGDDGLENIQLGQLGIGKAFSEFQQWLKKLKYRGALLTVCSKNTESVAKEPFERHPDMVLRMDDIAMFVANWDNKVDNIRHIQRTLNIGFDSMVFLDDNPFERNMVRENIPEIIVPELPEDPAEYLEYLYPLNLFETVTFSGEDAERTRQYQVEAQRSILQKSFTSEDEFLKSLNMTSRVEPFNTFNTPRVAQLSQRSNQFNLRTVRYTEADIETISSCQDYFTFTFNLSDKFGDNGLICVIILRKENSVTLFIDTWFMSCRVLKRGMENFTLNTIAGFARDKGFTCLKGEYLETPKNTMVKDHYSNLGFTPKGDYFFLELSNFKKLDNHIVKL
jgi:FkbH-like protein